MEISIGRESGAAVARVAGRVDAAAAPLLEQECARVLGLDGRLVLDLGAVVYISSAGLRVVLAVDQLAAARGGRIHLVLPGGLVREIFEISGFLARMPVYPDVDAAVRAFGRE